MSQNLAPPPPGPAAAKRRRALPWLSDKADTRAIQIGVIGTLLIHLLLLLLAPRLLRTSQGTGAHPHEARQFNIVIAPSAVRAPPAPKPPMKFVETNPNAPENTPNKTNNFSDRNQRVAQEKPTKGHNDMPTTEGRKDIQSTQIVDGRLTKPEEAVPTPPKVQPKTVTAAVPRQAQNPLAGFEKSQGDDKNGTASNIGKMAENQKMIPQKIDGANAGPINDDLATAAYAQIDPRHPQPRRLLEQHSRPAVFSQNAIGTSNIGLQAADAKWSNYGVYLQRLVETVQIEFERLVNESKIYPAPGSVVSVRFVLNSKGEISRVLSVDPSEGTSQAAAGNCVSSVTIPAPYGPWTEDMIAALGKEQELTFTFLYQ